jgi:hypothetical protein
VTTRSWHLDHRWNYHGRNEPLGALLSREPYVVAASALAGRIADLARVLADKRAGAGA